MNLPYQERLLKFARLSPMPCENPQCMHAEGLHHGMGGICQVENCDCVGQSWPQPARPKKFPYQYRELLFWILIWATMFFFGMMLHGCRKDIQDCPPGQWRINGICQAPEAFPWPDVQEVSE